MNETTFNSVLSLARNALAAVGGVLVAKGVLGQADLDLYLGAVMVAAPALWGIWDKVQHARQMTDAVNAGIAKANADPLVTPPVATPAEARQVVKSFGG